MRMILWGNLSWHPAAAAWRDVAPGAPVPDAIEVLRRENGTGAYRLVGAGAGGRAVVARRWPTWRVRLERTLHEWILSRFGSAAPRCYCFRPQERGFAWVFRTEGSAGVDGEW